MEYGDCGVAPMSCANAMLTEGPNGLARLPFGAWPSEADHSLLGGSAFDGEYVSETLLEW